MEYEVERNIYFKIAIFAFMAYLFFMFFGTKMPFQQKITEARLGGSSNIVNQVVYPLIFLLSMVSLFVRRLDAIAIIRKEKLLTIFLIWCLISIVWSYSPLDTAKRFFRTFTLFAVTLSLLVHTTSTKEIMNITKPVLYLYIFLSVIACIVIPGAIDAKFHTWRGFEDTKNGLGSIAVICIILSYYLFRMETGGKKIIAGVAVVFSLSLLIGARSATSISNFVIVVLFGSLLMLDELFKPLGLGRTASVILYLFVFTMVISFILVYPEIIAIGTESIGKDPTFTGRTDLWTAMLISISHHPLLGTGYQAFWSVSPPSQYLEHIYQLFIWIPNESHNGYIDIANEVGLIGLGIFLMMIIKYFINMRKFKLINPWKWIIIAALIGNMQESYFISFVGIRGSMVLVSYLILFGQLWREDIEANYEIE